VVPYQNDHTFPAHRHRHACHSHPEMRGGHVVYELLSWRMSLTGRLFTRSNKAASGLLLYAVYQHWQHVCTVRGSVQYRATSELNDIVKWSHPRSMPGYRLIDMISSVVLVQTQQMHTSHLLGLS